MSEREPIDHSSQHHILPELAPRREREFSGKIIAITGVSKPNGLGRFIANAFAREGAAGIIINSTEGSKDLAMDRIDELKALGTDATWVGGDIGDEETTKNMYSVSKERFGKIDVVVCNAGVTFNKPVNGVSLEEWDKVIDTNLRGDFLVVRDLMRLFPKNGESAVVMIGSSAGSYGNSGQEAYTAAKEGVKGLVRSLTKSLGVRGIRFNGVIPGYVATDMTESMPPEILEMMKISSPLKKFATAEDVANGVLFFAGPRSAAITGQFIEIDAGLDGGITAILPLYQAGYRKQT